MANGTNLVILIGNLGKDPELKYTQDGTPVGNFSIAVNESWVDRDNKKHEKVEWVSIVVWKKLAEICGQYLKKGSGVYIEGKLQTRDWQDKEGNKRYKTEVVASKVKFLDSKNTERPQQELHGDADGPL